MKMPDLTPIEFIFAILNLSFLAGAGFTLGRLTVEGILEIFGDLVELIASEYYFWTRGK